MRIAVVGAGAMGTALAGLYSQRNDVSLWVRRDDAFEELHGSRINTKYLPGYTIPEEVDLVRGPLNWSNFDIALFCVPTQFLRPIAKNLHLEGFQGFIVNTAKGLEIDTFKTPCEILEDLNLDRHRIFSLSGPSHAEEMCQGIPTSLVLGGLPMGEAIPIDLLESLSAETLRPYFSRDRLGVELGGALKNIIAIACGISEGLGFGMNTTSAIITRGLSEIKKYGVHRGAEAETFTGLSCLGDLVTTCCSPHSRNRNFGRSLVKHPQDPSQWGKLVEGASTVRSLCAELQKIHLDMPLSQAIHSIVWDHQPPLEVIQGLLHRPYKEED